MDNTITILSILTFVIAFLGVYAATPLTIWFANRFQLVDDPKKRFHPAHTHKGIVPRAGGLALFLGIAIASWVFVPMNQLMIGTLLAGALLVGMGLLDDKTDVNPYIRLCTNALASLIVIACGATIPYITNPLSGGIISLTTWTIQGTIFGVPIIISVWSTLVAFLWIMWTINIIGWSSGVDGQMPGFVSIAAIAIGILSLRYSLHDASQIPVTLLAFLVAGAFAGFLPWNFFPQKIMPGYGGKTLAGLLLGLLGILSYAKLGTALLVLGVPTIDAIYTLIRRLVRKHSPVEADWGHLHHKLLDLGWGRRRIALFYWGVSAILGLIALEVKSEQKLFALLLVSVTIAGFILWVNFFSQFSKPHGHDNG